MLKDTKTGNQNIYLVTHGELTGSSKGRIGTLPDAKLSEDGIIESEYAGAWFYDKTVDSIFSSPLSRAVEAADILAKMVHKGSYFKHSGLSDKKEGDWLGKTYWQIREEDENLWKLWSDDSINFTAPGDSESVASFIARIGRAMNDIRKNYDAGEDVVIVTHEKVVKAIIMHALDIPTDNFFRLSVGPGTISKLEWNDSYAVLKYLGLSAELQEAKLA